MQSDTVELRTEIVQRSAMLTRDQKRQIINCVRDAGLVSTITQCNSTDSCVHLAALPPGVLSAILAIVSQV